jgi:hypothetical protein
MTGCVWRLDQVRQVFWINEDLDAARRPWLPSDEAGAFEREHHLVNRRRADAKVLLHVGFRRGSAMQTRIEVDKGQVLPLLGGEGFCRRTHAGHPIQLLVRASNTEARHECALSGRPQPNRRTELRALLSGREHAFRKLKRAQILVPKSHNHCAEPLGAVRDKRPLRAGSIPTTQPSGVPNFSALRRRTPDCLRLWNA